MQLRSGKIVLPNQALVIRPLKTIPANSMEAKKKLESIKISSFNQANRFITTIPDFHTDKKLTSLKYAEVFSCH